MKSSKRQLRNLSAVEINPLPQSIPVISLEPAGSTESLMECAHKGEFRSLSF